MPQDNSVLSYDFPDGTGIYPRNVRFHKRMKPCAEERRMYWSIRFYFSATEDEFGNENDFVAIRFATESDMDKSYWDYKRCCKEGREY